MSSVPHITFAAFRQVYCKSFDTDRNIFDIEKGIALYDHDETIQYLIASEGVADETIIELLTVLGLQELEDRHIDPQEYTAGQVATQQFRHRRP